MTLAKDFLYGNDSTVKTSKLRKVLRFIMPNLFWIPIIIAFVAFTTLFYSIVTNMTALRIFTVTMFVLFGLSIILANLYIGLSKLNEDVDYRHKKFKPTLSIIERLNKIIITKDGKIARAYNYFNIEQSTSNVFNLDLPNESIGYVKPIDEIYNKAELDAIKEKASTIPKWGVSDLEKRLDILMAIESEKEQSAYRKSYQTAMAHFEVDTDDTVEKQTIENLQKELDENYNKNQAKLNKLYENSNQIIDDYENEHIS